MTAELDRVRRYDHEALKAILRGDPIPAEDLPRIQELVAAREHLERWRETERQETLRIHKAIMLARTIDDCVALLEGRDVPVDRLRPEWLAKYGLAA